MTILNYETQEEEFNGPTIPEIIGGIINQVASSITVNSVNGKIVNVVVPKILTSSQQQLVDDIVKKANS